MRTLLAAAVRAQPAALPIKFALRAATRPGELSAEAGDTADAVLGYRRAVELLLVAKPSGRTNGSWRWSCSRPAARFYGPSS